MNKDLRKEWEEYLEQTRMHVEVLTPRCERWASIPAK